MSQQPKSKWIRFDPAPRAKKTLRFFVVAMDGPATHLGLVSWHAPWRRYSFFPAAGTLFESRCLSDIAAFLDWLMAERDRVRSVRDEAAEEMLHPVDPRSAS